MTEILLSLKDVAVCRGARTVLDGINLSVDAGSVYALLGGNGAGKSTALFATMGLLPISSGSIDVVGHNPATQPDAARKLIAYLPETVALYEHLSARENVSYFLSIAGQSATREDLDGAFERVKLPTHAWDSRLGTFSKGMRQKTAIALALLRKAPVLLLDEPTTGLDPSATQDFYALVTDLKQQGVAILMVTHDLLGASDCADTIGLLVDGKLSQTWQANSGQPRFDVRALHQAFSGLVSA